MDPTITIADKAASARIYEVRGMKVMIDEDLAELYDIKTKRLNEQVKRNKERFPEDFMFQLTENEWLKMRSQNATSTWGGRRTLPYVFTEHGVLMLSSVLNNQRAISVNIQIMRVFTRIRKLISTNQEIMQKLEQHEHKVGRHDEDVQAIFGYLKRLLHPESPPRKRIGFKP